MRSTFLVAFVLTAAAATAQPTWVTLPDGGRVPCDHPSAVAAGLGCGLSAPATPATPPEDGWVPSPECVRVGQVIVCQWEHCAGVSPYRWDDRAQACHKWAQAQFPAERPVYRLGAAVQHPYGSTAVVIGLAQARDGVEVVTLELTRSNLADTPIGAVTVCRNDGQCAWLPEAR